MKTKLMSRSLALVLALVMLLPMISIPSFAEETTAIVGDVDFESYETGTTLKSDTTFAAVPSFNKVLEDATGNRFVRIPIVATDASGSNAIKTKPTNRAGTLKFKHAALTTTDTFVVKLDLWRNVIDREITGKHPNVGVWVWSFTFNNAEGVRTNGGYLRFGDVDLLTGEFNFNQVSGTKTGAAGLLAGQWNEVEFYFNPADGKFDIYVNGTLYARDCVPTYSVNNVSTTGGTDFQIPADQICMAVCSSNSYVSYTEPADAGADFEDAFSLDVDNVSIKTSTGRDVVLAEENFEARKLGATDTLVNGSYKMGHSEIVNGGNDGKALRIPFVTSSTTNKGRLGYVAHGAISAGSVVSVKTDIFPRAVAGAKDPYAGMWFLKTNYLPNNGATEYVNANFPRLFEFNLATGAIITGRSNDGATRGTLTGAAGLTLNAWNTVEALLDTATGTLEIYVNGALYLKDGYFY